jgi:carbonic anhydrase/acetyltransferase-like protein (isoleucine patch superfamily)
MDMQHPSNRGPLYIFEGIWPTVHESAFIAPTAAVIGNVTIGEQSNIWYHCVLRGDSNFITIGKRVNIQDGALIHRVASDGSGWAANPTAAQDRIITVTRKGMVQAWQISPAQP